MATPTRFTKLANAGQKNKINSAGLVSNAGDWFNRTEVFTIPVVASATAQDTGIILPAGVAVLAFIRVNTAEVTGTIKTIDIGLSGGTGAEFGNDLSVAATGVVLGEVNAILTQGDTITYTLGSANFAELDAEVIIQLTGSDE